MVIAKKKKKKKNVGSKWSTRGSIPQHREE